MKKRGTSGLIAFCVAFSLLSGTVSASNLEGAELSESKAAVSGNGAVWANAATGGKSAKTENGGEFIDVSEEEESTVEESTASESAVDENMEAATANALSYNENPATGITWTVTGDTVTFGGESSRDALGNDFWSVLRNAKHIKFVDCKITGSMDDFFQYDSNVESIDASGLDTSGVTSMKNMFWNCSSLASVNLSGWNTGSVTSMQAMFSGCSNLTNLDLSRLNTSSVTTMGAMFYGCSSLASVNLSGLNTGSVTNMGAMFWGCNSLTILNLRGWDTRRVTVMSHMFSQCSSLESVTLSTFDTSNVIYMDGMFANCRSLKNLDLSGFHTGNVTNMIEMFVDCRSLQKLDLSGLNTEKLRELDRMFMRCSSLTELDLRGLNTSNVATMHNTFAECGSLRSVNLSGLDTSKVTSMHALFYECSSLRSVDLSGLDTSSMLEMSSMFHGCSSLAEVNMNGLDTSKVIDMTYLFYGCSSLTNLDLSSLNMEKISVGDGRDGRLGMFAGAGLITLKTPRALDQTALIDLPGIFADPGDRETDKVTTDFLSTTLTRKRALPARPPVQEYFVLTGTITGHKDVAYSSVTARLVGLDGQSYSVMVFGGNTLDGTDKKSCTYSVSAPAGQYSLEVEAEADGGIRVNRSAVVKLSRGSQTQNINLPNGQAKVNVNKNSGSKVLVGGLDSLILADDGAMLGSASAVEVTFTADSAASLKEKPEAAAIQSAAPAQTMEFYDFSIVKTVDGNESSVPDTGAAVVMIVLPFEKKGKENVKVYRYHNGAVSTLTEQGAGGEKIEISAESITIYAKKFSLYAVGYTVSADGTDGGSGTANTGGAGGPRVSTVVTVGAESSVFLKPQAVDWKNVLAKVNAAQSDANVDILTGAGFTVPKEIIQALSGTDRTLALQLGHGTAISLSGRNIRKAGAAFKLSLTEESGIPEAVRQNTAQGASTVREFALAREGTLPYLVNVHLALGAENAGRTARLYRYDAKSEKLSLTGSFRVTAQGQAMFALRKGGGYLVTVSGSAASGAYTVVRGDSLYKIAARHGVSLRALLAANPQNKNVARIYPGQVLQIPAK